MSVPSVLARRQGRVGRLTLNRPEALHALNADMVGRMTDALTDWRADPEIEIIVLDHAEQTRGFCAGGDVRMLAASGARDGSEAREFFAAEYRLNTLIKEYPKPYLSIMDGVTMGGGVGISVHGSHRLATARTVFAMPETGIGLFPDVGGGWFLPRLKGHLGMWLALSGHRLRGTDVQAAGIATHYMETAEGLTDRICTEGLSALAGFDHGRSLSFSDHTPEINACFGHPDVEVILSSLRGGSDWARAQAAEIESKSPLSLRIAHRQLAEGAQHSNFRDTMRMEYRIACRLVRTRNFLEGVRAVLIDRDNDPKWDPQLLETVSDEFVGGFFASLGEDELVFIQRGRPNG
ncbi:enoyl-CoA hydratase/isomerase family protein [Synechococcus moorigangaii CMS01]|nr:enoyl-CoA hydratase/isomerase family protein [Synechococcus moorigangaii CMS01]